MNEHYEQWSRLAGIGMLLIGAGASIIGRAAWLKGEKKGFFRWFIVGTIGLAATNAGVAFFGEAVKHRTLYEIELKKFTEK